MRHLLPPPGVFGRVETGQVFVVFEDVHLQAGPVKREEGHSLELKQQHGIRSYKLSRGTMGIH